MQRDLQASADALRAVGRAGQQAGAQGAEGIKVYRDETGRFHNAINGRFVSAKEVAEKGYQEISREAARAAREQGKFTDSVNRVGGALRRQSREFSGFNDALNTSASVLGSFARQSQVLVGSFISSAIELERMRLGLETITGSAAAAEAQYQRLVEAARLPGLDISQALRASQQLIAVGQNSVAATNSIKAFGNALALSGRSASDLNAVVGALRQITGEGKVLQEDLGIITSRIAVLTPVLRELYGTTRAEGIRERLERDGKSVEDFITDVTNALARLPTAADTTANAIENLRDTMNRAAAAIGRHLLPAVKDAVGGLESLFQAVEDNSGVSRFISVISAVGATFLTVTAAGGGLRAAIGLITKALGVLALGAGGKVVIALGILAAAYAGIQAAISSTGDEIDQFDAQLRDSANLYRDIGKFLRDVGDDVRALTAAERAQFSNEGDKYYQQLNTQLEQYRSRLKDLNTEQELLQRSSRELTEREIERWRELGEEIKDVEDAVKEAEEAVANLTTTTDDLKLDPSIQKTLDGWVSSFKELRESITDDLLEDQLRLDAGIVEELSVVDVVNDIIRVKGKQREAEEELQKVIEEGAKDQREAAQATVNSYNEEIASLNRVAVERLRVAAINPTADQDRLEDLRRLAQGRLRDVDPGSDIANEIEGIINNLTTRIDGLQAESDRKAQQRADKNAADAQRRSDADIKRAQLAADRKAEAEFRAANAALKAREDLLDEGRDLSRRQTAVDNAQTANELKNIAEVAEARAKALAVEFREIRDPTEEQRRLYTSIIAGNQRVAAEARRSSQERFDLEREITSAIEQASNARSQTELADIARVLQAKLAQLEAFGKGYEDYAKRVRNALRDVEDDLDSVTNKEEEADRNRQATNFIDRFSGAETEQELQEALKAIDERIAAYRLAGDEYEKQGRRILQLRSRLSDRLKRIRETEQRDQERENEETVETYRRGLNKIGDYALNAFRGLFSEQDFAFLEPLTLALENAIDAGIAGLTSKLEEQIKNGAGVFGPALSAELTAALPVVSSFGIAFATAIIESLNTPDNLEYVSSQAGGDVTSPFAANVPQFGQFSFAGETRRGAQTRSPFDTSLNVAGFTGGPLEINLTPEAIGGAIASSIESTNIAEDIGKIADNTEMTAGNTESLFDRVGNLLIADRQSLDVLKDILRDSTDTPLEDLIAREQGILTLFATDEIQKYLVASNREAEERRRSTQTQTLAQRDPDALFLLEQLVKELDPSRLPPGIEGVEGFEEGDLDSFIDRIRASLAKGVLSPESYTDLIQDIQKVLQASNLLGPRQMEFLDRFKEEFVERLTTAAGVAVELLPERIQAELAEGEAVMLANGETVKLAPDQTVDVIDSATVSLAPRQFVTLLDGTTVPLEPGQTVTLATGQTVTLKDGETITVPEGATVDLATKIVTLPDGTTVELAENQTVTIADGQTVTLKDGSTVPLAPGQTVTIAPNQTVTIAEDQTVTLADGETITLPAGTTVDLATKTVTLPDGTTVDVSGTAFLMELTEKLRGFTEAIVSVTPEETEETPEELPEEPPTGPPVGTPIPEPREYSDQEILGLTYAYLLKNNPELTRGIEVQTAIGALGQIQSGQGTNFTSLLDEKQLQTLEKAFETVSLNPDTVAGLSASIAEAKLTVSPDGGAMAVKPDGDTMPISGSATLSGGIEITSMPAVQISGISNIVTGVIDEMVRQRDQGGPAAVLFSNNGG